MLSKENKEKLVLTGLYKCQPNKKYRGQLYWNDMYHCFNWTFKIRYLKDDDIYLMVDTYFNEKCIELTDENFDEFEFLFDFNEVHEHSGNNIWEYNEDEYWHVTVDSRGWYLGGKYFVKNNAVKNKEKVKSLPRLTYRAFDKYMLLYGTDAEWRIFNKYDVLDNAIQKLAEYENIDTVEELKTLKELN